MRFQDYSNILISGCSQSGKTQLVKRIITNAENMFQTPPETCIYVYTHWQPAYEEMQKKWKDRIIFTKDIPTEDFISEMMEGRKHGLFVVDDKVTEVANKEFFTDLLTRMAHHHRLTNCILVQDPSLTGKMKSVLTKNFHVNILLRSPRDRNYLRSLGIMLNDYKCILEAYDDACSEQYGYLVLDLHPKADSALKYRTKIFPDDEYGVIYQNKQRT